MLTQTSWAPHQWRSIVKDQSLELSKALLNAGYPLVGYNNHVPIFAKPVDWAEVEALVLELVQGETTEQPPDEKPKAAKKTTRALPKGRKAKAKS